MFSSQSWNLLPYSIGNFADMSKLRISGWGDYAQCNHKGPDKRDAGGSESVADAMTEARSWSGVEYRWLLDFEKEKVIDSPLKPPERTQPC